MATVTHSDIYKEVRAYLLGLFLCPPGTVIKGYQNNSPLPENAVVMTILFEHALDVSSNYYDFDNEKTAVQQSIEVTMQIDFYGNSAGDRARKLSTLWKNTYTTGALMKCQPLYSKDLQQITFINEKSQYEPRWMVEVALQYNPEYEHVQTFMSDMPDINLINP